MREAPGQGNGRLGTVGKSAVRRAKIARASSNPNGRLVLPHRLPHLAQPTMRSTAAGFDLPDRRSSARRASRKTEWRSPAASCAAGGSRLASTSGRRSPSPGTSRPPRWRGRSWPRPAPWPAVPPRRDGALRPFPRSCRRCRRPAPEARALAASTGRLFRRTNFRSRYAPTAGRPAPARPPGSAACPSAKPLAVS